MQSDQIIDYVKQLPLRNFPKDTVIVPAGIVPEYCYAIQSGFVKISSLDSDGREQLHWIAGRYDVVPTEAFFRKTHELEYFYTAMSDVTGYEISKLALVDMSQQNPEIALEIAQGMSEHFDDMLYRVKSNSRSSLREKIMFVLLHLCQRFGTGGESFDLHKIGLAITQQDIANMVGASRESTTIELNKLRDEHMIDYDRSSFIVHYNALSLQTNE